MDLPAVFGATPMETIGVILFLVWVIKHSLNTLAPKVYTNWLMPILAAGLGVMFAYWELPSGTILDAVKPGVLAGASAVFLFAVYDNLMKGYKWYTDSKSPESKKLLSNANKQTGELANYIASVLSYWKLPKRVEDSGREHETEQSKTGNTPN